jgi:hypothetical protein
MFSPAAEKLVTAVVVDFATPLCAGYQFGFDRRRCTPADGPGNAMTSDVSLVVGLVGATGSGKTTIAQGLVERAGFANIHMGRPIKDMLRALGLTEQEVAGSPEDRAQPLELLSGRSAATATSLSAANAAASSTPTRQSRC